MEFGRFQIESELGRGAFGRVYQAFDPATLRRVAVKVLSADSDAESLRRFRSEAAMTADLAHKNIVRVFEFAEEQGCPYLVMELLEGKTLQQVIGEHPATPSLKKLEILQQVAEGLQYAHAHGVIHRDVKPGNIMVCPDQSVKIMDFGTAGIAGKNGTRQTQKGDLLGTILYMAPELFAGAEANRKADIFSYGVVCYEFLAGQHPFGSGDVSSVMARISTVEPQPIRSLVADCPEGLDGLMEALLQKDPEVRAESFDDVLLDLNSILRHLRSVQAAEIFACIPKLMETDDFRAALDALRRVLALDPGHSSARELRDELRRRDQERALRARLEAAKAEATELISVNRLAEARAILESAAKLDLSDGELVSLLESVKLAMDRARRLSRLLSEARWEEHNGNLESALQKAAEAAAIDPTNEEASKLVQETSRALDEIAQAARRREEAKRAAQSIRGAIETDDLATARLALDNALEQFPGDENFAALSASLAGAVAARDRRLAIGSAVTEVRSLLDAGSLEEALQEARQAEAQFGYDPAISKCKAAVEQEIENRSNPKFAMESIEQALRAGDWDAAATAIAQAKADFGGRIPIQAFEERVAQGRHQDEVAGFASAVRATLALEDFDAAEGMLADKRSLWKGEEMLRVLDREFREWQVYATALLMAERALASGEADRARQLLLAVLASAPDARASQILAGIPEPKQAAPATTETPAPTRQLSTPRPRWWIAAVIAAGALAVMAVFLFSRPRPKANPHRSAAAAQQLPIRPATSPAVSSEAAWQRTSHTDLSDLKEFAAHYPNTSHAAEADELIASLTRGQQQKEDRKQILGSIAAYAAAIRGKREPQLKHVWPGISPVDLNLWHKYFAETQSIEFQLQAISDPVISGVTARVDCRRKTQRIYIDKHRLTYSDNGVIYIRLRKYESRWAITAVSAP